MTAREKEVLELIKQDPMISQNEIAQRLSITRSSVSVYIGNLIKKGKMRGRGYVISEDDYSVVIGAANFDLIGVIDVFSNGTDKVFEEGNTFFNDENEIRIHFGGTAKNVAENATRLGINTKIIAALAQDLFGQEIARECNQHSISTEACFFGDNLTSSMYLELRSRRDYIHTGVANVSIQKHITPEFLETKSGVLKHAQQIVMDDGLPKETLEYVTATYGRQKQVLLLATQAHRVNRYCDFIDRFAYCQFNFRSAVALARMESISAGTDMASVREIARRLQSIGVGNMLFPIDYDKLCFAGDGYCNVYKSPSPKPDPEYYQGSRDALMAGLMYSIAHGLSLDEMAAFECACREATYRTRDMVNMSLCPELIKSIRAEMGSLRPI
ncbi:MAG: PfkB family carbohydrate kinase [Oscillospiraceae bacterium]|nr:PfkB family carbohydrate kinase [Oscillospiraceae bacterium]